jgi:hypothetical protein
MRRCECGRRISTSADPCPYCGKRYTTRAVWMAIGIALFFVAALVFLAVRSGR